MRNILLSLVLVCSFFCAMAQGDDRGYIVNVGDMAPDIEVRYTDGIVKKLSDFRGKTVMLQFTASWCRVCRMEMPFIERDIWKKHKDDGNFVLVGIDLKETREKTEEFARQTGVTYPLTLDPEGKSFYSFAARGTGVTRNVIINSEGRIAMLTRLYNEAEFSRMCEVIDRMLAD